MLEDEELGSLKFEDRRYCKHIWLQAFVRPRAQLPRMIGDLANAKHDVARAR